VRVGVAGGVAEGLGVSQALRLGLRPGGARSGLLVSVEGVHAAKPGADEWRAIGSVGWLWSVGAGPVHGWAGAVAAGGVIAQSAAGEAGRRSVLLGGGPVAGVTVDVSRRLGLWCEAEWLAVALRRDDRAALAALPAALGGMSVGF